MASTISVSAAVSVLAYLSILVRKNLCRGVGIQNGAAAVKAVWWFLKKLNIVTYDPAILLLGIYPKD